MMREAQCSSLVSPGSGIGLAIPGAWPKGKAKEITLDPGGKAV